MTQLLTAGTRGPHLCDSALQRSVQCLAPTTHLVLTERISVPVALSSMLLLS